MFLTIKESSHSESIVLSVELPRPKNSRLPMEDGQKSQSITFSVYWRTPKPTLKLRDSILRNALLLTSKSTELPKVEEEHSELTEESLHSWPLTATSNFSSLRRAKELRSHLRRRLLEWPRNKLPDNTLPSEEDQTNNELKDFKEFLFSVHLF